MIPTKNSYKIIARVYGDEKKLYNRESLHEADSITQLRNQIEGWARNGMWIEETFYRASAIHSIRFEFQALVLGS